MYTIILSFYIIYLTLNVIHRSDYIINSDTGFLCNSSWHLGARTTGTFFRCSSSFLKFRRSLWTICALVDIDILILKSYSKIIFKNPKKVEKATGYLLSSFTRLTYFFICNVLIPKKRKRARDENTSLYPPSIKCKLFW